MPNLNCQRCHFKTEKRFVLLEKKNPIDTRHKEEESIFVMKPIRDVCPPPIL